MPLNPGFPGHSELASFADIRRDLEGAVVRSASGSIRAGVFPSHLNPIVVGRSDMRVAIGDFRAVQDRVGAIFLANVGTDISVLLDAAPVSNRRIDLIYCTQRSTVFGDAASTPIFGVVKGTASPTPIVPSLPANLATALRLATVEVPASATSTLAAGVIITQVFPYTAMAGGQVVARNLIELEAWTPTLGARAYCIGDDMVYVRTASGWQPTVGRAGFTLAGSTWDSGGGIFNGGSQTTIASINATIGSRVITPTLAGRWRFTLNGAWAENNAGLRQAALRKNNVSPTAPEAPGSYAGNQVAASGRTEFSLSVDCDMNGSTDFMALSVYQNSGGRLALTWVSMTAEYLG